VQRDALGRATSIRTADPERCARQPTMNAAGLTQKKSVQKQRRIYRASAACSEESRGEVQMYICAPAAQTQNSTDNLAKLQTDPVVVIQLDASATDKKRSKPRVLPNKTQNRLPREYEQHSKKGWTHNIGFRTDVSLNLLRLENSASARKLEALKM